MQRFTLCLLFCVFVSVLLSQSGIDHQYYKMARELADGKNFDGAIFYYDKAITENPGTSLYYDNRGYAKYMINDLDGAVQDYLSASRMVPDEPLYYYMIGNIYQKKDSLNKAIKYYSEAIQYTQEDIYPYYLNRANSYYKLAEYQSAINDYDKCMALKPKNPAITNNRGISFFQIQDTLNACLDWKIAYEGGHFPAEDYLKKHCREYIDLSSINFPSQQAGYSSQVQLPKFQGKNTDGFRSYIAKNLRYPEAAAEGGLQGMVIVKFSITAEGKLDSVKILNGVHESLNKEALRVIISSDGMWESAKIEGQPINIVMAFPIRFTLRVVGSNNSSELEKSKLNAKRQYNTGNYEKALEAADKHLLLQPSDLEMWEVRINSKEKLGDISGSQTDRGILDLLLKPWNNPNLKTNAVSQVAEDFPPSFTSTISSDNQSFSESVKRIVIFYDSIWQITDRLNAKYYRNSQWNANLKFFDGQFQDFTIDDSALSYGNYQNSLLDDSLILYNSYGDVSLRAKFKYGNPIGNWYFYCLDGSIEKIVSFEHEHFIITEQYLVGDTMIYNGTGDWRMIIKTWGDNDNLEIIGQFENYQREGRWEIYEGGKLLLRETYNNNKFKRGIFFGANGKEIIREPTITFWIFLPNYFNRINGFIKSPATDLNLYPFLEKSGL